MLSAMVFHLHGANELLLSAIVLAYASIYQKHYIFLNTYECIVLYTIQHIELIMRMPRVMCINPQKRTKGQKTRATKALVHKTFLLQVTADAIEIRRVDMAASQCLVLDRILLVRRRYMYRLLYQVSSVHFSQRQNTPYVIHNVEHWTIITKNLSTSIPYLLSYFRWFCLFVVLLFLHPRLFTTVFSNDTVYVFFKSKPLICVILWFRSLVLCVIYYSILKHFVGNWFYCSGAAAQGVWMRAVYKKEGNAQYLDLQCFWLLFSRNGKRLWGQVGCVSLKLCALNLLKSLVEHVFLMIMIFFRSI